MEIRKSTVEDIPAIMEVYEIARKFMRDHGNYAQWINGYPQEELIREDIRTDGSYVCVENQEIVGTFYFHIGDDETYHVIENGQWSCDREYGVIHRLGSSGKAHGLLKKSVEFCAAQIDYLRVDTHADNKPMQGALKKNGFHECGVIYVGDGTPRVAFDQIF